MYNVLSAEKFNEGFKVTKLETDKLVAPSGNPPSTTPVTEVTPTTLICAPWVFDVNATPTTLAKLGSGEPPALYLIKSLTLIKFPGKRGLTLTIVLIPETISYGVTVAIPTKNPSSWITSAVNVFENPTFPSAGPAYTDLTSDKL